MMDSDARETFFFASWIEPQYILTHNLSHSEKKVLITLFV